MKRILFIVISALVIVTLAISGPVLAAATTKLLSTNFTLVNLGSEPAIVNVQYLLKSGVEWPNVLDTSKSFTLDANGGQKQIRQYFDTMDSGSGSAVVSSNQQLGAVVQIMARNQVATQGAYVGAMQGSDTYYVPLVAHRANSASGTVNSQIIIQNTSSVPVDVTVDFLPITGWTKTYTKTFNVIQPGVSVYYDIQEEMNLEDAATSTTSWFGSAVVNTTTTDGSVMVVSNLFSGPNGMQTFNAFPKEKLTEKWFVPIFTARLDNGLSTVVTIQNLSGGTLNVDDVVLRCTRDGDPDPLVVGNPTPIDNNASYSFNPVIDTGILYPAGYAGACTVTAPSGKNIVAIVQMRIVGRPIQSVAAYEAIPQNITTTSMLVPLVAKRLSNGFASVVNIVNLSASENTVRLDYIPSTIECPVSLCDKSGDGKVDALDTITIDDVIIAGDGGNQLNHRVSEPALPSGWVGSLIVTSKSGLPISGIVQLSNLNALPGDTLMAHGTFGK